MTAKLGTKHQVLLIEVRQCFENITGEYVEEIRVRHKTNPPTYWFLSETNNERLLKIVFVQRDGNLFIKTAYEPNAAEIELYKKLSPE